MACAPHDAIAMEVKDLEDRRHCQNESRDMEDGELNYSTKE